MRTKVEFCRLIKNLLKKLGTTKLTSAFLAFKKLAKILYLEKYELYQVYIFAILSGVLYVLFSLLLNSVINLVQAGVMTTSLLIMIGILLFILWMNSYFQIKQMRFVEKMQQKLFARYTLKFSESIFDKHLSERESINRASYFTEVLLLQKAAPKLLIDLTASVFQILLCLILLSFYHSLFIGGGLVIFSLGVITLYFNSNRTFHRTYLESKYKYQVFNLLFKTAISNKNIDQNLVNNKLNQSGKNYINYRILEFNSILFNSYVLFGFKWLITGLLLLGGGYLVVNKQITIGQFVASEIIIILISSAIDKLVQLQEIYYSTLVSADKIMDSCRDVEITTSIQEDYLEVSKYQSFSIQLIKGDFQIQIPLAMNQKSNVKIDNTSKDIPLQLQILDINGVGGVIQQEIKYIITKDSARKNQFINADIFDSLFQNEDFKNKIYSITNYIESKNDFLEFLENQKNSEELIYPYLVEILMAILSDFPIIIIEDKPNQQLIDELINAIPKLNLNKTILEINYGK